MGPSMPSSCILDSSHLPDFLRLVDIQHLSERRSKCMVERLDGARLQVASVIRSVSFSPAAEGYCLERVPWIVRTEP